MLAGWSQLCLNNQIGNMCQACENFGRSISKVIQELKHNDMIHQEKIYELIEDDETGSLEVPHCHLYMAILLGLEVKPLVDFLNQHYSYIALMRSMTNWGREYGARTGDLSRLAQYIFEITIKEYMYQKAMQVEDQEKKEEGNMTERLKRTVFDKEKVSCFLNYHTKDNFKRLGFTPEKAQKIVEWLRTVPDECSDISTIHVAENQIEYDMNKNRFLRFARGRRRAFNDYDISH